jgi:hypothetical protein
MLNALISDAAADVEADRRETGAGRRQPRSMASFGLPGGALGEQFGMPDSSADTSSFPSEAPRSLASFGMPDSVSEEGSTGGGGPRSLASFGLPSLPGIGLSATAPGPRARPATLEAEELEDEQVTHGQGTGTCHLFECHLTITLSRSRGAPTALHRAGERLPGPERPGKSALVLPGQTRDDRAVLAVPERGRGGSRRQQRQQRR